jgi:hypothetical protein
MIFNESKKSLAFTRGKLVNARVIRAGTNVEESEG